MLNGAVKGALIGALLMVSVSLWYWVQLRRTRGLPVEILEALRAAGALTPVDLRAAVGRTGTFGPFQVSMAVGVLELGKRVRRVLPPGTRSSSAPRW